MHLENHCFNGKGSPSNLKVINPKFFEELIYENSCRSLEKYFYHSLDIPEKIFKSFKNLYYHIRQIPHRHIILDKN